MKHIRAFVIGMCLAKLAEGHGHMVLPKPDYFMDSPESSKATCTLAQLSRFKELDKRFFKWLLEELDKDANPWPPLNWSVADDEAFRCKWGIGRLNDVWLTQGTQIGCSDATGKTCSSQDPCCEYQMKPTLHKDAHKHLLTIFNHSPNKTKDDEQCLLQLKKHTSDESDDITRINPWRAPGYAPVADACGVNGGFMYKSEWEFVMGLTHSGVITDSLPPKDLEYPAGALGSKVMVDIMAKGKDFSNVWQAGSVQKVAWAFNANHGGGYSYRLCERRDFELAVRGEGKYPTTEACFQATPLRFVGDEAWIHVDYGDVDPSRPGNRTAFRPVDVTAKNSYGVNPPDSHWRKNPVPNCASYFVNNLGQNSSESGTPTKKKCIPSFTPTVPRFYGQGNGMFAGFWGFGDEDHLTFESVGMNLSALGDEHVSLMKGTSTVLPLHFAIVDEVQIPSGLSGEFVLSWRWDCEQTAQIWANCAHIKIIEEAEA